MPPRADLHSLSKPSSSARTVSWLSVSSGRVCFNNAESLVLEVARGVLAQHGRALTPQALAAAAGRRPLEAWQATVDALGLTEVTAQQLYDESEALLKER